MKTLLQILLFLVFLTSVRGQTPVRVVPLPVEDDPIGYNMDTLRHWVLDMLHGGGGIIDTASITYTGDRLSMGRFFNGVDVGMNRGLILSNGKVESTVPPNNVGLMSDKMGTPGDPDLLGMYNQIFDAMDLKDTLIEYTGDAAVLEFTYKPFGDEVILDYVFLSEEYPNVRPPDVDLTGFSGEGDQIYDLFGISIEQPGRPFFNQALRPEILPGPGTPDIKRWVNVGNLNTNSPEYLSSYYVQNPTIVIPTGIDLGTQYDGLTKKLGDYGPVLFARKRDVIPCRNYKVKIAIEDFYFTYPSNEDLDGFTVNSAVMLGARSLFGGVHVPMWTSDHYFTRPDLEGQLIEQCNDLVVNFELDTTYNHDYYIPFRLVADAYSGFIQVTDQRTGLIINDSVCIPEDSLTASILVEAIGLSNDIENVVFQYAANPCEKKDTPFGGPIYTGRIPLTLRNNDPITFSASPKVYEAFCKETIDLTITDVTLGGVTPLTYIWNGILPPAENFTYQVSDSPDFVNVEVNDICSNVGNVQVRIDNKPMVLDAIQDAFLCGPGQFVDISVTAEQPDYPDFTIDHVRWYKIPDMTPLGDVAGNTVHVEYDNVVGASIWTCGFEVTDCCGGTQTGQFLVNQSELTLGDDLWICKEESVTITANAQANAFKWYAVNDPTNILSVNNQLMVTPDITTTYELWILDLCNEEQTARITVNVDLFEPVIIVDPLSAEICPDEIITLTANDAESWLWEPGGFTGQILTLQPDVADTYTYALTSSSLYCIDKQATATFIVFPRPAADFSFDPANDACTGEEIQFSYADDPSGKIFEWDFGDQQNSHVSSPTHSYLNAGSYTVNLIVDQYICSDSSGQTIVVNPLPEPDFSLSNSEGCLPVEVDFSDLTLASGSQSSYLWDFGDGTTSIERNPVHVYDQQGNYSVTLTVQNTARCGASIIKDNAVQANPNPIARAEADPWITTMDNPVIDFTNESQTDSTIISFVWDFDDGQQSTDENPTHSYLSAGDYTVTFFVETINGCMDDTVAQVAVTENIRLYFPNAFTPDGDGLNDTFEIKGTPVTDFNLYIFDRWGNQIWSTHRFETQWDGTTTDGTPVPAGTYGYVIKGTDYRLTPVEFTGTVTVVR